MDDIYLESWNKRYHNYPPIGFILRSQKGCNFMRIHSLSDSKRSSNTNEDSNLILEKFSEITKFLFQRGEKVVVFLVEYEMPSQIAYAGWNMSKVRILPSSWVEKISEYNDTENISIYSGFRDWEEACANDFCLAVNENEVGSVTLFSCLTGNALCPYDGGFDVFIADEKMYSSFSRKFINNFP